MLVSFTSVRIGLRKMIFRCWLYVRLVHTLNSRGLPEQRPHSFSAIPGEVSSMRFFIPWVTRGVYQVVASQSPHVHKLTVLFFPINIRIGPMPNIMQIIMKIRRKRNNLTIAELTKNAVGCEPLNYPKAYQGSTIKPHVPCSMCTTIGGQLIHIFFVRMPIHLCVC